MFFRIEPSCIQIEWFTWTPSAKRFNSEAVDRFVKEGLTGWARQAGA